MKTCTRCHIVWPKSEFTTDRQKIDGVRSNCKKCDAVYAIKYRKDYCNTGLGYFRDRPGVLARAKRYVEGENFGL